MTKQNSTHASVRSEPAAISRSRFTRFLPVILLAAATALVFATGWHKLLSFKTIGLNYEVLRAYIESNILYAILLYAVIYIGVIALSLPGGAILTLSGGLLLGWQIGAPVTIVAATIGATIIFLIAKHSIGDAVAGKVGPWVEKLSAGFRKNAFSYLLFLRLVPAFPFFVVNLVPALLGIPLRTYVLATFIGIIPATTAFSFLGSGLGSVVEAQNALYAACTGKNAGNPDACVYTIDTKALITPELLTAFGLLAIVALIPVGYNAWANRRSPG
jgi:uncharacterized membrane protein YdjX (TVP38/TMEM64 family)